MASHLQLSNLHIVLLGRTGSGKSASGNTIIGGNKDAFIEGFSPVSVTRICKPVDAIVDGQNITVIDTVGLSDTSPDPNVQDKIEEIFQHARHGIDVFLLVIKLGTSSEDNKKHVEWIQKNFGAKIFKHTIVLFTHGDLLKESIEQYVEKCGYLFSVVDKSLGKCHVFDNKCKDRSQVKELLKKIGSLRVKNKYSRYNEPDYAESQRELLKSKCFTKAKIGGAAGAVAGGAVGVGGGAVAVKMGAALTAGKFVAAGAAGVAGGLFLGAAAFGVGMYWFARKYVTKN